MTGRQRCALASWGIADDWTVALFVRASTAAAACRPESAPVLKSQENSPTACVRLLSAGRSYEQRLNSSREPIWALVGGIPGGRDYWSTASKPLACEVGWPADSCPLCPAVPDIGAIEPNFPAQSAHTLAVQCHEFRHARDVTRDETPLRGTSWRNPVTRSRIFSATSCTLVLPPWHSSPPPRTGRDPE